MRALIGICGAAVAVVLLVGAIGAIRKEAPLRGTICGLAAIVILFLLFRFNPPSRWEWFSNTKLDQYPGTVAAQPGTVAAQQLIASSAAFPSGVYAHNRVMYNKIGKEARAAWIFTPEAPRPRSAPVIVFLHGYGAHNPYSYGGWIEHLVRNGNIVIYPVYQISPVKAPAEWLANVFSSTKAAIENLQRSGPVIPELTKFAAIGHSAGGGIAVQVAAFASAKGLPVPSAIMCVQPGSVTIPTDEVVIRSIPSSVLLLVVDGDKDQFSSTRQGPRIYNLAEQIPVEQRAYILLRSPANGSDLVADHYAPLAPLETYDLEGQSALQRMRERIVKKALKMRDGQIDQVDTGALWPLGDGLLSEAFSGHRSMRDALRAAGITGLPASSRRPMIIDWSFAGNGK